MKKYLVVLALIGSVIAAPAAPPSDQSIEQMMSVLHVQNMLAQMLVQMDTGIRIGLHQGLRQSLKGKELNAKQKKQTTQFHDKLTALKQDESSFANIQDTHTQV